MRRVSSLIGRPLSKVILSILSRFSIPRGDLNRQDRGGALHRAWGHVFNNHLLGDYYEFGVYQGASLIESYRQYKQFHAWLEAQTHSPELWRRETASPFLLTLPRTFIGCDTFAGLPENDEGAATFRAGYFSCADDIVLRRCRAAGFDPVLIKGLFADTRERTRNVAGGRAAIVNLDGDLYESAVDALETITPLVQQGTVLLCDDYRAFNNARNKGERRALAEWQANTGIEAEPWFAYQYAGQAFLLNV